MLPSWPGRPVGSAGRETRRARRVIDRHMVSGRTYHDSGHFLGSWIKTLDAAAQKVSR